MQPKLSIIVYRGDPVGLRTTRHTAPFITAGKGATGIVLHVTGAAGFFGFEQRQEDDPRGSRHFTKQIPVEPLRDVTKQQLMSTTAGTPIDNRTQSWNCQHWVAEGLTRIANQRWIGMRTKSGAIGEMVDVIMEAEDEVD
ncbi:hypothetical protein PV08_07174 [Exophiala spinifera]|uniref:Uncharacterized protein n=1 Tax=Exophiala spinifera TaxID=91928 RepID=A0A0D1ZNH8_9EURO|nr:uncharacterized protein PV08_07174 [Exophiala spinifera]KIW14392.1 hypothetical protein PV08_07174 [Exophiala spinifera]